MIGQQKYITIATDAGVWPQHRLSVWACYIVAPQGIIQACHPFKEYVGKTYMAETLALRNALHILQDRFTLSEYKIIVYGEVEETLRSFTTKAGNVRKRDLERSYIVDEMIAILDQSQGWEWRHVKAHTNQKKALKEGMGITPAKYKLNRWCDLACRQLGRKLAKELKAQAKAAEGIIEL